MSFNALQAAVKAGYSQSTARKCELLHLPKVQAYLKAGMAKTAERLEISHDRILRELAKVAFANMGDYYDENAVLKPMNKLTPDEKAAIQQYQLIDAVGDYGERAGELSKIKLHNKMSALDKIARHTGFYMTRSKNQETRIKKDDGEHISEVKNEMAEVRRKIDEEVDMMEDGRGKMEDVIETAENILTLSHPVRMENGRGKMEDVVEKNLTISHPDREARGENQEARHSIGMEDVKWKTEDVALQESICTSAHLHIRTLNTLAFAQQFVVDNVEGDEQDGRNEELVERVGYVAYLG